MPRNCKRADRRRAADLLLLLMLATGCSSTTQDGAPGAIGPAQPADSPPVSHSPAGVVLPLNGHPQAAIFDARTRQLVVLTPGGGPPSPASITVFGAPQIPPHVIGLPGPATALTGDGSGTAYLSGRGGYFVVDLSAGQVTRVSVAGTENTENTDFTAIARRADSELMLGSSDGAVYTLARGDVGKSAPVLSRTKIFTRVDSIATQGNTAMALDRGQTSVTTINADGKPEQALRAGQGATTLAADPAGRVLVADTRGGQLLVFGVDPLILRQEYPVRQAPYGLAGSNRLAWISQTATNMVIGYDLTTGIPVEKVRYPTVRQPNLLAFDDASGTLYVVSGSGAGVQVIEQAAGPR